MIPTLGLGTYTVYRVMPLTALLLRAPLMSVPPKDMASWCQWDSCWTIVLESSSWTGLVRSHAASIKIGSLQTLLLGMHNIISNVQ